MKKTTVRETKTDELGANRHIYINVMGKNECNGKTIIWVFFLILFLSLRTRLLEFHKSSPRASELYISIAVQRRGMKKRSL